MKIFYDHQTFSLQKYGGISKYFSELIKNLPSGYEYKLSLLLSENHYLKENHSFFKKANFSIPYKYKGKGFLKKIEYNINRWYSMGVLSTNKYDLFHPTFYDNYFFDVVKKPYVVTVHDLMAFKYQDNYLKDDTNRPSMERVIKNANRIISISENTKRDLIDILKINPERIDVIYHGYTIPTIKSNIINYDNYLLFVGKRSAYKNFTKFICAISELLIKDHDLKLICVGDPFEKEEIEELRRLGILKQTLSLSVDEASLNNLYANAIAFVYPSLYEGFGMPILEAFANSCPVCLSNNSCFPEVAGEAGIYFDPNDEGSISEAVSKVLNNNVFRDEMIRKGKEQLKNFSWKKTAEKTVETYKKALER